MYKPSSTDLLYSTNKNNQFQENEDKIFGNIQFPYMNKFNFQKKNISET